MTKLYENIGGNSFKLIKECIAENASIDRKKKLAIESKKLVAQIKEQAKLEFGV